MSATRFDVRRVWLVLLTDLRGRGPVFGLIMLAFAAVYLALHLLLGYYGAIETVNESLPNPELPTVYVLCFGLFFLYGVGLASQAFQEAQGENSRTFHLALPVTRLELLAAKAVLTLALFPAAIFVSYALAHVVALTLTGLFFTVSKPFALVALATSYWQDFAPVLLVCQTLGLLGAARFATNPFFKTLAVAGFAATVMVSTAVVTGWLTWKVPLFGSSVTVVGRASGGHVGFTASPKRKPSQADAPASPAAPAAGQPAEPEHQEPPAPASKRPREQMLASAAVERLSKDNIERLLWLIQVEFALVFYLLLPVFCLTTTYVRLRELEG